MAKNDSKNVPVVPAEAVGRRLKNFGANEEFKWSEVKCTACARCSRACPVEAITVSRTDTLKKRLRAAPCSQACPAGLDVSRYVRFIAEGKYDEAAAVIRERAPFPYVLGHICKRPCESKCQRGEYEGSLQIRALKRIAAENDKGLWRKNLKITPPTGKKAAIVGSGPAGLSAAYFLALLGHQVTVFEALPDKGGKMLSSIPEYQLPKTVMRQEIDIIESLGVEIRTGSRVNSVEDLFGQGFDTAVLAIGVLGWGKSLKLPIPGSGDEGVIDGEEMMANDWQHILETGKPAKFARRVNILGGGSLAFRIAVAAARGGAKEVHIFGQEHTGGREADSWEVDEALAEGVVVHSSSLFYSVTGENGKVTGVTGQKIRAFGYDQDAKLHWDLLPGTEEHYPADKVISALGKTGDRPTGDLEVCRNGVFAIGDAVNEQRSVIESIAAGRWAASMADMYLGGHGNLDQSLAPAESAGALTPVREVKRRLPALVEVKHVRIADGSLAASEQTLTAGPAVADAARCLKCDLCYDLSDYQLDARACVFCGRCVESCIWNAIVPSGGFASARKRAEEAESKEQAARRKLLANVLTILVAAGAVLIAAVVLLKAFE